MITAHRLPSTAISRDFERRHLLEPAHDRVEAHPDLHQRALGRPGELLEAGVLVQEKLQENVPFPAGNLARPAGCRHCRGVVKIRRLVGPVVDEQGDPGVAGKVRELPGGPAGREHQAAGVVRGRKGDERAVRLAFVAGGEHREGLREKEGAEGLPERSRVRGDRFPGSEIHEFLLRQDGFIIIMVHMLIQQHIVYVHYTMKISFWEKVPLCFWNLNAHL